MAWVGMIGFVLAFAALGFVLGAWRGPKFSRFLALTAISVFAIGLAAGLLLYSRDNALSNAAYVIAWATLSATLGSLGPALFRTRSTQAICSALATIFGAPLALVSVLYVACGCCGQCI